MFASATLRLPEGVIKMDAPDIPAFDLKTQHRVKCASIRSPHSGVLTQYRLASPKEMYRYQNGRPRMSNSPTQHCNGIDCSLLQAIFTRRVSLAHTNAMGRIYTPSRS